MATGTPTPTPVATGTPTATASAVPAVMRSVNMSLYDASDQLVTNAGTQALLRAHGTPLIRMPYRDGLTDAQNLQAMTAIKNVGAIPLLIVHGACVTDPYTPGSHQLALAQQVFGSGPVYVEYGNEEDLSCAPTPQTYTASWNAVVSQLKATFPAYRFVGPVTSQANSSYIASFVAGANPQPDIISWHEYVCNTSESDSYCQTHIANWATHVANTNAAVQAAVGHPIPIMITEWNLDPQADARYQNAAFIEPWTTAALQQWATLQSQGVMAAFLYTSTNHPSFQLINSDNSLTPQGIAFWAGS